jgi:hypothetical protein
MAVTACNFIGAEVEEDVESFATYTATYEVITNAVTDGPYTVRQHPELPKHGDTFQNGPSGEVDQSASLVGRKISLREIENSRKVWRAVLRYTNNPGGLPARDPEDPPLLPWNEPPQISTHAAKDKQAILFDLNDRLIASSAGEPYDPVQERDLTKFILRIVRNLQFVDVAFNATYRDCINSDPFFGCDPDTVKVETPGTVDKLWFGNTPYYQETWEFAINMEEWLLRLYDYGMYRKVGEGATAKLELLRDLHNVALTAPRLMDGDGGVLAIGGSPVFISPDQTDLGKNYFEIYRRKAFGPLNLPQSF